MSTVHSEESTVTQDTAPPDGLVGELLARRRKRLPLLTLALIILVAAGAAFIGGVEVQKHWGKKSPSSSSGVPSSFARAFAGGSFPGATGSGSPSAATGFPDISGGNATTGTVTLIKGKTLYVTTAAGNTVLVKTSKASRVTKSVRSSVRTIHPGDSVTVVGAQNKDGSVTARRLTIGGTNG